MNDFLILPPNEDRITLVSALGRIIPGLRVDISIPKYQDIIMIPTIAEHITQYIKVTMVALLRAKSFPRNCILE
jgi:hypothetical protein